jgi:tetratricopeptide (TPR) repeat protein
MRQAVLGLSLALALFGGTFSALAQQPGDRERAKASFRAGANAYAAGDYLAAIQALEAAYELTPLPAIAFSLAQAERKQYLEKKERQHLQRALELYRRYLEQEPNGARVDDARTSIAELGPQLKSAPVEAAPKLQVRPTRLMIVTDTPGARITLDGGAPAGSPLIREVTPGKHRAHIQATGYHEVDREVTAVAGELILTEVRLSERPTSLYVWAPPGADLYVDGVYVGQGGPLVTVPLAIGEHQLTVAKKGQQVVRRNVRLQRGQTHTEVVSLEPTAQRRVSEVLFIGSGAALGASLVLSAFAARSENRAEEYLIDAKRGNVLREQLTAYNASVIERNRYRSAAVIGVAGSLGFLITGLFLHELDRPTLAAPRQDFGGPPRADRPAPRLAFSPVTATGDFGAALQLHF